MFTMRYRRRLVAKASRKPNGRPIRHTQLSSAAIQIARGPSAVLFTPDTKWTADGKKFALLSHRCIFNRSAILYNYFDQKRALCRTWTAWPPNSALEPNAHSCIERTTAAYIDVGAEHRGIADTYRKKRLSLAERPRRLGPFPAVASAQRWR